MQIGDVFVSGPWEVEVVDVTPTIVEVVLVKTVGSTFRPGMTLRYPPAALLAAYTWAGTRQGSSFTPAATAPSRVPMYNDRAILEAAKKARGPQCECGAHKAQGIARNQAGHSRWCPWA